MINLIKSKTSAQILAVVKADAYGHGLIPVAKCAIDAGATWLGVALLDEAITLREAGIKAPIISWLTPPSSDFKKAIELDIDLAIPSLNHLELVLAAGKALGKKPSVHIEVDTGMTRGGLLGEWPEFLIAIKGADIEVFGRTLQEPMNQMKWRTKIRYQTSKVNWHNFKILESLRNMSILPIQRLR